MALVFCDSFNSYAATGDLANIWTNGGNWTWSSSAGRNSDGAIVSTTAGSGELLSPNNLWPVSTTTVGFLAFFKCAATPASQISVLDFYPSNGTTYLGGLVITTSGFPALRDGGLTVRATGSTNICDGSFHWIELKFDYRTSQNQKCYVDGVQQWNTTTTMAGASTDILRFSFQANTTKALTWSYPIVLSNASPSPQVSDIPIGQLQISTLRPNGDSSVQFSRSTGSTNYTLINEVVPDGDTSYVQDNVSGHVDLYNFDDLSYSPQVISSVQLSTRIKNPGAGTINFKTRCSSQGTTSDTASTASTAAYVTYRQILDQDPKTSAAWGITNLNAALFGPVIP